MEWKPERFNADYSGICSRKTDHNIGVLTQTPSETAIITADLALKAAAIEIGFIDRFSGTLIITGTISDVTIAFEKILEYTERELGFTVCRITKA